VSAQVGWITDFQGEILETRDGGRTWSAVYAHEKVTTAIHVSSERVIVTGDGGLIVRRRR
jgi:photosystem II stability/assembly factor-like uncharacterized protein